MKTTKRLYTAKRLYFTCPIKALYMMKEFGVKFEWRQKVKASEYDIFHDWGKTELHTGHTVDDFIDEVKWSNQIYVAVESEHIFEPKEGDLDADGFSFTKVMPVENHMTGKIDYYTDACWLVKIEEFTRSKEKSKTIFRDNKQFFMPEVENENN